ncbi:MAG: hypothetical protein D6744_11305 [Planctomycetota bacterium]|nr:MAG: hypothetical protein D6744_11305 [Planctomycetota bacterium]
MESHVGSLAVVAANDIWATGDKQLLSGGVFGTFLHFDGSAWTEIAGPAGVFPGQIAAVASDDVWAFAGLSASDELLFAHWDGSTWSLIPQGTLPGATPVGTDLFEMVADAGCNGWALGRVSTDNGATTSPLILQLQPGGNVLGDLDGDGDVDLTDLAILLRDFDCTGGGCAGDVDGDGDTDLSDLSLLLSNFGA